MNMDSIKLNVMYYTIMRRRQMKNLYEYDQEEWPEPANLKDYSGTDIRPTPDYYNGPDGDLFFELGEWLRVKNAERQLQYEETKRQNAARARQPH